MARQRELTPEEFEDILYARSGYGETEISNYAIMGTLAVLFILFMMASGPRQGYAKEHAGHARGGHMGQEVSHASSGSGRDPLPGASGSLCGSEKETRPA